MSAIRLRSPHASGLAPAALLALLAACGASPGARAPAAPAPQAALAAPAEREPGHDEQPTILERSQRGLAISPVPLKLRGLDARRRLLAGLGSYIVNAASDCAACHSGAGFLSGGNPFFLDHAGHVVWTRNLTPDPDTGLQLSLAQFKTAIRTGKDFHPGATRMLVVMPWTTLRWASDLDLEAIYTYLRTIPPVKNVVPPDVKDDLPLPPSVPFPGSYTDGDVARSLPAVSGSFDPARGAAISPLASPSHPAARQRFGVGSYIVNATAHCNDCHTHPDRSADGSKVNTPAFLTGGTVFAVPPPLVPVIRQVRSMSANLKGRTNGFFNEPDDSWTRFHDVIHTASHADEVPPRPLGFPMILVAPNLANLLEADLFAVYGYVKAIPSTTGDADQPRQDYARWCAADGDCAAGEHCAAATSECTGRVCGTDLDCDACQTCGSGHCQAPAADSVCLLTAQ